MKNKKGMVELYMAKMSRKIRRGNTKEVTQEMVNDIPVLSPEEFSKKYRTTESYFYKLYHDFTTFCDIEEEKIEEEQQEIEREKKEIEAKVAELESTFFKGIFPEEHLIFEKGFNQYRTLIQDKQSYWNNRCNDILHRIELVKSNQTEKLALFDMLEEARINRRIWHNAYEFIAKEASNGKDNSDNIRRIYDMLELRNRIISFKDYLNERKYMVRVMKEEFGDRI